MSQDLGGLRGMAQFGDPVVPVAAPPTEPAQPPATRSLHDSHGPLCGHRGVHLATQTCSTPCDACRKLADALRAQLAHALDGAQGGRYGEHAAEEWAVEVDALFTVVDEHIRRAYQVSLSNACQVLEAKGEHHAATALALLTVRLPQVAAHVDVAQHLANGDAR